jgi:thiol-disulfide isomerase/thioredoxin
MVRLKYEPEKNVKNLTGPCVIVIHAEWCGHCKDFMPVYNNEIVKSNNFDEELKDLLTLSSVEEKEYSNSKDLFGEVDGYPTIRYITFDENGKPLKDKNNNNNNGTIMKMDAVNIPRNSEAVTNWINSVVKSDIKKKHKHRHKNNIIHGMRGGSKKAKRVKRVVKRTKKAKRVKRLVKRTKRAKRS